MLCLVDVELIASVGDVVYSIDFALTESVAAYCLF